MAKDPSEIREWVLRYKRDQNRLHFKPKIHFTGRPGEHDYVCISENKQYADGEFPTVRVPEEIGYRVLATDSHHWDLWSPDVVTVGIRENLATVPKRFESIRAKVQDVRAENSSALHEALPSDVLEATKGDRVARMMLAKAHKRGVVTAEMQAKILEQRGLLKPKEEVQEEEPEEGTEE